MIQRKHLEKHVLARGKTRKTCKSDEFPLGIFSGETRPISRFWIPIHEDDPKKRYFLDMFWRGEKLEKHVNHVSFYYGFLTGETRPISRFWIPIHEDDPSKTSRKTCFGEGKKLENM